LVALEFESELARRIVRRDRDVKGWSACVGAVLAVVLVVNFTSGSLAAPRAVVHVGTHDAIAQYMGQYDSKSSVMMLSLQSAEDWVCIKVPFKGSLSDLTKVSFSEFVSSTGGEDSPEPYVVIRMTEGRNLVCHPSDSYAGGDWWLPLSEWQLRDTVAKGMWMLAPTTADSPRLQLAEWQTSLGSANVLSINLYVGCWNISYPYISYVGDLVVNSDFVGLSNIGRCTGSSMDLPAGF